MSHIYDGAKVRSVCSTVEQYMRMNNTFRRPVLVHVQGQAGLYRALRMIMVCTAHVRRAHAREMAYVISLLVTGEDCAVYFAIFTHVEGMEGEAQDYTTYSRDD